MTNPPKKEGAKVEPEPKPSPESPLILDKKEVAVPPPHRENAEDHYKNCPDCHKKINLMARAELEPEILKESTPKIIGEYKKKALSLKNPVLCKGCGEIVEGNERECPSCHGTKAREL